MWRIEKSLRLSAREVFCEAHKERKKGVRSCPIGHTPADALRLLFFLLLYNWHLKNHHKNLTIYWSCPYDNVKIFILLMWKRREEFFIFWGEGEGGWGVDPKIVEKSRRGRTLAMETCVELMCQGPEEERWDVATKLLACFCIILIKTFFLKKFNLKLLFFIFIKKKIQFNAELCTHLI